MCTSSGGSLSIGKSMDFGAVGRAGLRTAFKRRKAISAAREFFFVMFV